MFDGATTRSFPLLRRVIDASIEGTCMIVIGVRKDDVAEDLRHLSMTVCVTGG